MHKVYFESLANGYKFKFDFNDKFNEADPDIKAIESTFNDLFNECALDIEKITELACVTNLRCWYWHDAENNKLSNLYADLYYKVRHYVYEEAYDKKIFNDTDISYYFKITD